ncbi:MAG: hypothetical protein SGARI_005039 [Bacillariaceae sp.]
MQHQQQQQPQPSSLLSDFQAGVTATLRSWSALRTAVEGGWGGGERESQQKGEVLRQNIFDVLNGNPKATQQMDIYDLADNLAIYLEEEFSVTLEDNSEQQVAETICKLYEECIIHQNPTMARQLVANAEGAVALNSQFPVQVQTTGENDDDDDDGDAMMGASAQKPSSHPTPSLTVAMQQDTPVPPAMIPPEYLQQPLFGKALPQRQNVPSGPVRQLGEAIPEEEPVAEMDDDGFAAEAF